MDINGDGTSDVVFVVNTGKGGSSGWGCAALIIILMPLAAVFFAVIVPDYFEKTKSQAGKAEDNKHFDNHRWVFGKRPYRLRWEGKHCTAIFKDPNGSEFKATFLVSQYDDFGEGFLGGLYCSQVGETDYHSPLRTEENMKLLKELQLLAAGLDYGKSITYDPQLRATGFNGVLMSKKRDPDREMPPWRNIDD